MFRGRKRIDDILRCLANGDYIYVYKRAPKWWPFRVRLELGIPFDRVYIVGGAFNEMLSKGWLQSWGETYYDQIYAITQDGRDNISVAPWERAAADTEAQR